MFVMDGHCDAISKLLNNPQADFNNSAFMDVTLSRLQDGCVKLQSFAIFIANLGIGDQPLPDFQQILMSIDLYERHIVANPHMTPIRNQSDLIQLLEGTQIGAFLTLEGVDGLNGNLLYLRMLYQLGVRSVGLTWNHANWAADGVGEPRGGGLTVMGKKLVQKCEKLGILIDVSHLSEAGFWDVAAIAQKPFYASHSNAFDICQHPRNLKNEQIDEIVRVGGRIGLTFVPYFVSTNQTVPIVDLLKHIDHICERGGSKHIIFGSDFDGIDQWIVGLEHPGQYSNLQEILLKHYKQVDVENWIFSNWYQFLFDNL
jgi:membrane dipeptidase